MENQKKIDGALSILRANGGDPSRVLIHLNHTNKTDENRAKYRALDGGLCSTCPFLQIDIQTFGNGRDSRKTVGLKCRKNLSPIELYIDRKPDNLPPSCSGYPKNNP